MSGKRHTRHSFYHRWAERLWPKAWVYGNGPIAVLMYCSGQLTIQMYEHMWNAELIWDAPCGWLRQCHRDHAIVILSAADRLTYPVKARNSIVDIDDDGTKPWQRAKTVTPENGRGPS